MVFYVTLSCTQVRSDLLRDRFIGWPW